MALTHLYYLTDSFHALIHSDDKEDDDDPPSAVFILRNTTRCKLFRVSRTSRARLFSSPHDGLLVWLSHGHTGWWQKTGLEPESDCSLSLQPTFLPASLLFVVLSLTARQPRGASHWSIISLLSYRLCQARQADYTHDSWEEWHRAHQSRWRKPSRKVTKKKNNNSVLLRAVTFKRHGILNINPETINFLK